MKQSRYNDSGLADTVTVHICGLMMILNAKQFIYSPSQTRGTPAEYDYEQRYTTTVW